MSDPTAMPFQEDPGTAPDGPRTPEGPRTPDGPVAPEAAGPDRDRPAASETDLLASRVSGPEDHVGMTALWRLTMDLRHWWFVAVGEQGQESPAAATIADQLMLLAFTTAERARDFAVEHEMVAAEEDLRAIALPPHEVVQSAGAYADAGIDGLMFDPHLAGYFIPTEQLPIVWDAVSSPDSPAVTGRG